MENESLVTLTADIVAAHVSNNNVAIGDVGTLVRQVHNALANLSQPAAAQQEARQPAVSVRSSIKSDSITCLICGKKQKALKRHLGSAHGLTPAQYRDEFYLPVSYPMVAPEYAEKRRELAKSIGLGRKPGARGKAANGGAKRGKA